MIPIVTIIFFILSIIVCLSKQKRANRGLLGFVYFILILIATFRSNESPDYQNYYDYFTGKESERIEIGFKFYIKYIQLLITNTTFIFGAVAALSIGIKIFTIRRLSSFVWASLLVYVSNFFILHDMIQIRVAIASSIFLWATQYLYKRDAIKYFISAFIAMLFHTSSIIMFPLWLINAKRIQKNLYLILIPISYCLVLGGITFGRFIELIPIHSLQVLWQMYQIKMAGGVGVDFNIFNIMLLLRGCMCLFIVITINSTYKRSPIAILWMKIYVISICALLLLSDIPVVAFRISEFLQIIEILLIPVIIYVPRYQHINRLVVVVFASCSLFINIYNQYLI